MTTENSELLRRLDEWHEGVNPGPLIRWAAAHIRGCTQAPDESGRLREALLAHEPFPHYDDEFMECTCGWKGESAVGLRCVDPDSKVWLEHILRMVDSQPEPISPARPVEPPDPDPFRGPLYVLDAYLLHHSTCEVVTQGITLPIPGGYHYEPGPTCTCGLERTKNEVRATLASQPDIAAGAPTE